MFESTTARKPVLAMISLVWFGFEVSSAIDLVSLLRVSGFCRASFHTDCQRLYKFWHVFTTVARFEETSERGREAEILRRFNITCLPQAERSVGSLSGVYASGRY